MHIPSRPLGSYLPGPTPMATDGSMDQSCLGKVRSRPCALAGLQRYSRQGRHHAAARDPQGLQLALLYQLHMPEEDRSDSDRWRQIYGLRQVHT